MKFILGKKVSMTQVFNEDGKVTPVTLVKAEPCVITQVRTEEKDGYTAVQIGCGKRNKIKKTLAGHFKGLGNFAKLKEFRLSAKEIENLKTGQEINVSTFEKGDTVKAIGISRGFGFQGVVKRHGFHGQDKTHGNKDQLRMPGSIGATGPARVFKGTRMGGHMGDEQVTIKNLEVIDIDIENNILMIKGGLPGSRNSYVMISGDGELKVIDKETIKPETEKTENVEESKTEKVQADEVEEVKTEVVEETKKEESTEDKKAEDSKSEGKENK